VFALVDCNNFFVSCERLFRPDLINRPVLVLSNNDGCVVARSQEVRELGVPMGVPYFQIKDVVRCNNIQCFSSNFALYSDISQRIVSILGQYAADIEVYSIDEAFMDLANMPIENLQSWGDDLTRRVQRDIGMPVSVGIAPNKTLAKLASHYAKKQTKSCIIDPSNNHANYTKILEDTDVDDIWGVGRSNSARLKSAGIKNALQLSGVSESWVHQVFGVNGVRVCSELNGKQVYSLEAHKPPQKSLMVSRSFGHTINNLYELETAVVNFASRAGYKLRRSNQQVSDFGIYLRFKTPDGETHNQMLSAKLSVASNDTPELAGESLRLLREAFSPDYGYKKAGVFANNLTSANLCQVNLLDKLSPKIRQKRTKLMEAMDNINQKYGNDTIHVGAMDTTKNSWHSQKKRISPAYTTDWLQLPKVSGLKD